MDALVRASLARGAPWGFLPPSAEARVLAVAARFPAAATGFFGFECRPGGHLAETDFLFCTAHGSGEPEALAEALRTAPFGAAPWQDLGRFCTAWSTEATLAERIENLWLEFDLAGGTSPPSELPVPSVFVGARVGGPEAERLEWLFEAAALLGGAALPAQVRRAVADCLATLPEGGTLFQFGLMLSRPARQLRLCLRDVPAEQLASMLDAMHWQGARQALATLVARTEGAELRLGLDVTDRVLPRLGMEIRPARPEAAGAMHAALRTFGLAGEEELRELSRWWGLAHQQILRAAWDERLAHHPACPGPAHRGAILRNEHHVKITIEEDGAMAAKSYLAARLVWLTDEQTRTILRQVRDAKGIQ
jgi:hypothetical protein